VVGFSIHVVSLSGNLERVGDTRLDGAEPVDPDRRWSACGGPPPSAVGRNQRVRHGGGVRPGEGGRVLGQQVVPDHQPRTEELGLALGTGEEPDVQVSATVADAVDVASTKEAFLLARTPPCQSGVDGPDRPSAAA